MITFEDLKSGKVKPEFGNPEHIAAIKRHEQTQDVCPECEGAGVIEMECGCCNGKGKVNPCLKNQ